MMIPQACCRSWTGGEPDLSLGTLVSDLSGVTLFKRQATDPWGGLAKQYWGPGLPEDQHLLFQELNLPFEVYNTSERLTWPTQAFFRL